MFIDVKAAAHFKAISSQEQFFALVNLLNLSLQIRWISKHNFLWHKYLCPFLLQMSLVKRYSTKSEFVGAENWLDFRRNNGVISGSISWSSSLAFYRHYHQEQQPSCYRPNSTYLPFNCSNRPEERNSFGFRTIYILYLYRNTWHENNLLNRLKP